MKDLLNLNSYNYPLPKELIAQTAFEPADECKLLYCKGGEIKDLIFKDIEELIGENDVLFLNNSKVIKARIRGDLEIKRDFGDKNNQVLSDSSEQVHQVSSLNNGELIIDNGGRSQMKKSDEIRGKKVSTHYELVSGSKAIDSGPSLEGHMLNQKGKNIVFKFISQDGQVLTCNKCEIFFLKDLGENKFEALVYPGKKFKIGKQIDINGYKFEIIGNTEEGRIVKYLGKESVVEIFDKLGTMPLPPYIEYKKDKEAAYQPVFAQTAGSVAAPTASLHFTDNLLKKLEKKGIKKLYSTLHIGLGTFKVVDVENIQDYEIHSETVKIPLDIFNKIGELKENGKNLIAVGTTATRILESLPYLYLRMKSDEKIRGNHMKKNDYFEGLIENVSLQDMEKFVSGNILIENGIISFDTKLFIYPGFKYKLVDKLITNFHLPKSSLLMLVAAFMGYDNMIKAYEHAIKNKYRFFSFGDAMMIEAGYQD